MKLKHESGFTLIEIMVAIAILAAAILGLSAAATSVIRANQEALYSSIATDLAQDKLEELKSKTPTTMTSGGPATTPVNGVTFSTTWSVTPNIPVSTVRQIDVTVEWTDYTKRKVKISSAVREQLS